MNTSEKSGYNQFWADLIIEEFVRQGVKLFCVAPGARSAPLVLAAARNPRAETRVHFDERGIGFFALGYMAGARKPAAVITTSGTAIGNLFPAVIEASKKKLPLIVLTADRPAELQMTGAHQTIQQSRIFGDYCRYTFDFPCPSLDIKQEFVLTTVDHAVYRSRHGYPGPVHLNCPFREPLTSGNSRKRPGACAPGLKNWRLSEHPYTIYGDYHKEVAAAVLDETAGILNQTERGIILLGNSSSGEEQAVVLDLARRLQWPIFPDITSGLRTGCADPRVISYFDLLLLKGNKTPVKAWLQRCDGVLHLGGRLTSKRCLDWLAQQTPKHYFMVLNHPLRHDPLHNVSRRLEMPVQDFCLKMRSRLKSRRSLAWPGPAIQWNASIHAQLDRHLEKRPAISEPGVARTISRMIPPGHGLFLANSMPLRIMDMFADRCGAKFPVAANRGASGIDGTIASAAGFTAGIDQPVTLLIGDQAFLHDLNSLSLIARSTRPLICVILNNFGGGIFSFVPFQGTEQERETYFAANHAYSFQPAAELFGLYYRRPCSIEEFKTDYQWALSQKQSTCLELQYDRSLNVAEHRACQKGLLKD
ncbi:MAG: 2-succinyl-5-enolpyruvyl-6-hydroxy-3-cyclohexene-1-carboxylic-acid synthase [Candidatus Omnitrophota bacterium]|jgi:2-succinyl-5-enolpyruvyl-6-hydroxy-3-cyclohexene-1-carboxylate synthase